MSVSMKYHYDISGDFSRAGEASGDLKNKLKQMSVRSDVIRKVAIAMYEGEINMVIHAGGGEIDAEITPDCVTMVLRDEGPGIADIDKAMTAGYSTASENIRSLGFGAGMGLPNMKTYTDEMDIVSAPGQGTVITMRVLM